MPRNIAWWYWLASAVFLTAGLLGWHWGFCAVGTLAMVQVVHFARRERSLTAFPVQVRLAYLMILLAGIWEPLRWVYWLSAAGTWAMVLFGYCPLARTLSLMPWNRTLPISPGLVWRTFVTAPVRGNVLQGLPVEGRSACACRLEGGLGMGKP